MRRINAELLFASVFTSLLLIQILGLLVVYRLFDYQKSLSVALNISGRQRMLTQKMTKEAFIYANNPTPDSRKRFLETAALFEKSLKALREGSAEMKLSRLEDRKAIARWEECKRAWEPFYAHIRGLAEANPGSPEFKEHLDYIERHNLEVLKKAHAFVLALQDLAINQVNLTKKILFVFVGISVLIVGIGAFLIRRYLIKPLVRNSRALSLLAEGNLSVDVLLEGLKEVFEMALSAFSIARFMRTLNTGIQTQTDFQVAVSERVKNTIDEIAEGNLRLERVSKDVAEGAQILEEAFNQVEISANELSQAIGEISSNANLSAEAATETRELAERSAQAVHELEHKISGIAEVSDLIRDIAEQTNLLALNATIEAARAGEAGKGFAVVANEIKELSRQTANATERIKETIEEVSRKAHHAVETVERAKNKVEELSGTATAIAAAVEEQTAVVSDVARQVNEGGQTVKVLREAVQRLDRVRDELSETVRESKVLSNWLDEAVTEQEKLNRAFEGEIEEVFEEKVLSLFPERVAFKNAYLGHLSWRQRLVADLLKRRPPEVETDPQKCFLGQVLRVRDDIRKKLQDIIPAHEELHRKAVEAREIAGKDVSTVYEWFESEIKPLLAKVFAGLEAG